MKAVTFRIQRNHPISSCCVVNPNNYLFKSGTALWDTGATHSAINASMAKQLNLSPCGVSIRDTANGQVARRQFIVSFLIGDMEFHNVVVHDFESTEFDILIGLDIIGLGDFTISGTAGNRHFSFCLPSLGVIDYMQVLEQGMNNNTNNER